MDTVIRRLKIEQLHAQLELSLIICSALAREYLRDELSRGGKEGILRRWGIVLKESNLVRSALEALGAE